MRTGRLRTLIVSTALLVAGLQVVQMPRAQAAPEDPVPAVATSAEPLLDYTKLFYRESGWTGADAHLSVPLGGDKVLWLYGDSNTHPIQNRQHTCAWCIVRNSIGIQNGKDPTTATVNFYTTPPPNSLPPDRPDAAGQFFVPPTGDKDPGRNWFWPNDGVRTPQGVHVFLAQASWVDDPVNYPFGKHVADWIATITNPDAAPADWHITYRRLPLEVFNGTFGWTAAALETGGFVYLYGNKNVPNSGAQMTLARARPADVTDFFAWEFYDFDTSAWVRIRRDAAPGSVNLGAGPVQVGVYSVHHQPSLNRYMSTYTVTGFGNDIYARYAPSPTGPWSKAYVIHRCGEGGLDFRTTCYHGQGHPELARSDDEVVLSYSTWDTTNGTYKEGQQDQQKLGQLKDASYAFPRFVRVRFPGAAGRVEGESLTSSAHGTAPIQTQSGSLWSGNAQLWFRANRPGDYVEVPFDVPSNGVYAVSVTQTKAPDYGQTMTSVDGQVITKLHPFWRNRLDFDGYATSVGTETVENEPVYLTKGRHLLRLTVTGKNSASTGHLAGIDHVAARRIETRGPSRIEAETMLPPRTATAPADVQHDGAWFWWSGGGQLRVNATAAGQYAEFNLDVPISGHYDLTLGQTEFGEYGTNEITLDGQRIGPSFDAHNGGIQVTPVGYGTVQLASGRHTLRVTVTGKNAAATGYRAGIDYIDLRPAHNVEAGAMLQSPGWWAAGANPGDPNPEVVVQRSGGWFAWSGGGQLWLKATGPGQRADLKMIRAPASGYYEVSVTQTEAADYGINTITIDGQPIGQPFDAHNGSLKLTDVSYGRVRLTAGDHIMQVKVTGKNSASTGHFAGIDHVRLRPVPGPSAADKGPVGWDAYRRLDRLAELPTGVETRQFSSFDKDPHPDDGSYNEDGLKFGCLRTTGGRCVLAEAEGPGELTSMWFTRLAGGGNGDVTGTGTLRIELDGQVVLDEPLEKVVRGDLPAPFVWPLVADHTRSSGGSYIKVPMPYRAGMRVTTTNNPHFYSVAYRRFSDAVGVRTFDRGDQAQDVINKLRAAGTADPKPAAPGAQTAQRTVTADPGATVQLAQVNGPAEISALRLRLPQVVGPKYQPPITDDFRSLKDADPDKTDCELQPAGCGSSSEFTGRIDPANQGVRLTRRVNTYRLQQQVAKVFVDGTEVGNWTKGRETTRSEYVETTLDIPASLTAGKSTITIRTEAEPAFWGGFQEFLYRIDSRVGGQFTRTDSLDVGEQHTADEQAHGYRIVNQEGKGTTTATAPMTGDPAAIAAANDILTKARLRITFDGTITVDAPIGEFFGSGLGEFDVRSLMFAMDPDGWYSSWWPMPLRNGAVIELVNASGRQLSGVDASVTWAPSFGPLNGLAEQGRQGYFHAGSRSAALVNGEDWSFLSASGGGKLVGVSHTMRGDDALFNPSGYLEGDERIHADGSRSPQLHGTGTEDYYLGGWYFVAGPFAHGFSGAPGDLGAEFGCSFRCTGAYRLHLADSVPFGNGLRFGIEHGGHNEHAGTYGSTTFWYGRTNASLTRSDILDVGKPDAESAHGYDAPGSGAVTTLTAKFEGDDDTGVPEDLRATGSPVTFRMTVPVGNDGVLLRRMSDQFRSSATGPDQAVDVYVDDVPAGTWRQPLHNNHQRWLEDSFLLSPVHTTGKGSITIKLVPRSGSAPWSAARYEAHAWS